MNKHESECILFHNTILNVIRENINAPKGNWYFLLSIDDEKICWMIRIECDENMDKNINLNINPSNDYLNLLKFILPLGVKVKGILYLGSGGMESNFFDQAVYSMIRSVNSLQNDSGFDLIFENLYVIILQGELNISGDLIHIQIGQGKLVKYEPNADNVTTLTNKVMKISFEDILKRIEGDYTMFYLYANPIVIINRQNYLINEKYFCTDTGIYFQDLNIMIPDIAVDHDEWMIIEKENDKKLERIRLNKVN
jgi:hypothetical protein